MSSHTPDAGRSTKARIHWWIATGFGAGLAPVAPGTFGSLVGVAIAVAAFAFGGTLAVGGAALVACALGWISAGPAARLAGRPDPGAVVIDEIAGQLVALLGAGNGAVGLALGFALFRLLDITKPWPIRRLEKLPGASGIMLDDLAAGLLAAGIALIARRSFGVPW